MECQTALVEGPAAARAALAKQRGSIARELAQALEIVGSYTTIERGRTSLHEAVCTRDAATVEALIVASGPKLIDIAVKNRAPLLDLAYDDTCCGILEYHAAVLATINEDPPTLVAAALAHCATLAASEEPLPAAALFLRGYHFKPAFLWAPPAARAAVVSWALHVFIAQLTAITQPFERLPVDCAGDILGFFGMAHNESKHITKHCSSSEARAWVRAVIAAAVVAKATSDLVPAAIRGDVATVQDCLSKKANTEAKLCGPAALMWASGEGRATTVQVLLKAGADKDAKDKKWPDSAIECFAQWLHRNCAAPLRSRR